MILILSDGVYNKSVEDVIDWIEYFQGECICLNSDSILNKEVSISICDSTEFDFRIEKNGVLIPLDKINVVWNWRWFNYGLNDLEYNVDIHQYICGELGALYQYLKSATSHAYWWGEKRVNKIEMLREALKSELCIPATCVTDSKDRLKLFLSKHDKVIVKPISDAVFFTDKNKKYGMYTMRLTNEIVDQIPDSFFPAIFQSEIKKSFEIRSFFLNNTFFSAAIISQNDFKTSVDFRNYNLTCPNRIIPFKLPIDTQNKLTKLIKKLNLETGSIDLIYTGDKYYFLEINPVGQFDMVSAPCNFKLSREIADFLITKDNLFENEKKK